MKLPPDGPGPAGGAVGPGFPQDLVEDGDRVGIATDRQLTLFRSQDLAPLAELSYDIVAGGGIPVRAALHGDRAAVLFTLPLEEPGVARVGIRCMAVPR
jgi:hypothetical protein